MVGLYTCWVPVKETQAAGESSRQTERNELLPNIGSSNPQPPPRKPAPCSLASLCCSLQLGTMQRGHVMPRRRPIDAALPVRVHALGVKSSELDANSSTGTYDLSAQRTVQVLLPAPLDGLLQRTLLLSIPAAPQLGAHAIHPAMWGRGGAAANGSHR